MQTELSVRLFTQGCTKSPWKCPRSVWAPLSRTRPAATLSAAHRSDAAAARPRKWSRRRSGSWIWRKRRTRTRRWPSTCLAPPSSSIRRQDLLLTSHTRHIGRVGASQMNKAEPWRGEGGSKDDWRQWHFDEMQWGNRRLMGIVQGWQKQPTNGQKW